MLKILFHCHTYARTQTSGADVYAERLCTWLADKCEVKVIVDSKEDYAYKNHTVTTNKFRIAENYEWCDAVITNLVTRNQAVFLAHRFKKPIFHIVHNDIIPTLEQASDNYIIYNSFHLKEQRPLSFESVVVQPPTWVKDWKEASNRRFITLVNLTHNKGAQTFFNIAQAMRQFKFMGVVGGYGNQYMQPLPNIKRVPFTKNMQDIYDQTAVLVVPSKRETWSLCAAEAQCCGIPVIAAPLPGIKENLKDSAVYASNVKEFMDCITGLLCYKPSYDHYSALGLANQKENEKNHILQLENLFSFMKEKVNKDVPRETKEKKEIKPVKEKKIIDKPVTKIK